MSTLISASDISAYNNIDNKCDERSLLQSYIEEIKRIPMLTEQQEKALVEAWVNHQDLQAAQQLVKAHMRLVVKAAFDLKNYSMAMLDLISEGSIGLMHAVKKFNPQMNVRLATYAMWWIKAAMQDFILKSWSILKVNTLALKKKLFYKLNKNQDNINTYSLEHNKDTHANSTLAAPNQSHVVKQPSTSTYQVFKPKTQHKNHVKSINNSDYKSIMEKESEIYALSSEGLNHNQIADFTVITDNSSHHVGHAANKIDIKEDLFALPKSNDVISLDTSRYYGNSGNSVSGNDSSRENGLSLSETIADPSSSSNPENYLINIEEHNLSVNSLKKAFQEALTEREKEILVLRRLTEPATKLDQVANYYQISRERVRQIEESSLKKIKAFMLKNIPAA